MANAGIPGGSDFVQAPDRRCVWSVPGDLRIGFGFFEDPLDGHVEIRYDNEKGRVVYEPVSIVPRTLVPKVIRTDNRYLDEVNQQQDPADA